MVNLDKLLLEVIEDVKSVGFPVLDKLERKVYIDKGIYNRFGICHRRLYPEKFEIHLSEFMLEADVMEIKNILAHEVLHATSTTMTHCYAWHYFKDLMNEELGYNIKIKHPMHEIIKK